MVNVYSRVFVCVGALTVGLSPTAQAQAPQQAPPSQQQPAQQPASPAAAAPETITSADVSDQEVEQFVKSYEEVTEIQKATEKQLESVQDGTEVARAKQEANQKMTEALKGHGMKVERYNLIARSISQDPTLMQRIQQKIMELRQPV